MLRTIAERLPVRLVGLMVLTVMLLPPSIRAQQGSASGPPKEGQAGQSTQPDSTEAVESSSKPSPTAGTNSNAPPIRTIGRATPLGPALGPLRRGPVSVRSAQITQYFDRVSLADGSINQWSKTTLMGTDIAYDHRFRRGRLAIQYQPQLMVVDGRVLSNYSNQDLSFDSFYYLSPRWSLGLNDSFLHAGNRSFSSRVFFDGDLAAGTVLRNNFLDSPGHLISNATIVSLSYRLSQRTALSFSPDFVYTYTSGLSTPAASASASASPSAHPNSSRTYGSGVSLSHSLSARTTVAAFYSVHWSHFSSAFANSVYHTVGGSYSRHLAPTWHFSAALGLTRANLADARQATFYADASTTKRFRRSLARLGYTRDYNHYYGYIGNRIVDRLDATYGVELTRRLQAAASSGYQRETGQPPSVSGKYFTANLGYRMLRSVSAFAQYAHKNQTGQGSQVLVGNRNSFALGLRWAPPSPESSR